MSGSDFKHGHAYQITCHKPKKPLRYPQESMDKIKYELLLRGDTESIKINFSAFSMEDGIRLNNRFFHSHSLNNMAHILR